MSDVVRRALVASPTPSAQAAARELADADDWVSPDDADLVIAAEPIHLEKMRAIAPDADHLSLLSDHDPAADERSGLPDPWYGGPEGFVGTLTAIEAAMPGVLDEVRARRS